MSRDWTPAEIQAVSQAMKAAGHMSFEEFCEGLEQANQAGATRPGSTRKENIMEDIFEYRVDYNPDTDIEGLKELRAARTAWVKYHEAKTKFERGEIDDLPAYNPNLRSELEKKYPRAAAYLETELWIGSGDPIKIRLGTRGMEKIRNGEDPAEVLEYMEQERDAFNMAQEG